MAANRKPDRNIDYMMETHGTNCLITDYSSNKYLSKPKYVVADDRYSRHCGGAGGFDDFVERWHE